MAIVALTAIEFVSAAPTVTDITAKQRYPWNGLVDISCKVSGIEAETGGYEFAVVAVDKDSDKEYIATHCAVEKDGTGVSGWEVSGNGDYELLWDARADLGQVVIERMAIRVTLEASGGSIGKVQLWEGGPYWADRNIGADKPEDYGLYFWWGDTTGHRPSGGVFSFSFYSGNSAIYTYGKSISELQSTGWVTSDGVLAPAHDAAHVHWGGSWRMPTSQEFGDLNSKCDWTWVTRNGVKGYIVRGRGTYASNSIFLPAASYVWASSSHSAGSDGYYWSSVRYNSSYAFSLIFDSRGHRRDYRGYLSGHSYNGQSVRPVQGLAK